MAEERLLDALVQDRLPRTTLYLNEWRVRDFFDQSYAGIVDLVTTRKKGLQFEAGLNFMFRAGGKFDSNKETNIKQNISPIIQVILIEYYAKECGLLIDLSNSQAERDYILKYEGEGHITAPDEPVSYSEAHIRPDVAQKIQNERARQESMMRSFPKEEQYKTGVWTATASRKSLACIAFWHMFHPSNMISLMPRGLLGKLEREIDDIVFISPFWIWG